MIIKATVIFEINEEEEGHIDPKEFLGELVKVKSGEYENRFMGTIDKVETDDPIQT